MMQVPTTANGVYYPIFRVASPPQIDARTVASIRGSSRIPNPIAEETIMAERKLGGSTL